MKNPLPDVQDKPKQSLPEIQAWQPAGSSSDLSWNIRVNEPAPADEIHDLCRFICEEIKGFHNRLDSSGAQSYLLIPLPKDMPVEKMTQIQDFMRFGIIASMRHTPLSQNYFSDVHLVKSRDETDSYYLRITFAVRKHDTRSASRAMRDIKAAATSIMDNFHLLYQDYIQLHTKPVIAFATSIIEQWQNSQPISFTPEEVAAIKDAQMDIPAGVPFLRARIPYMANETHQHWLRTALHAISAELNSHSSYYSATLFTFADKTAGDPSPTVDILLFPGLSPENKQHLEHSHKHWDITRDVPTMTPKERRKVKKSAEKIVHGMMADNLEPLRKILPSLLSNVRQEILYPIHFETIGTRGITPTDKQMVQQYELVKELIVAIQQGSPFNGKPADSSETRAVAIDVRLPATLHDDDWLLTKTLLNEMIQDILRDSHPQPLASTIGEILDLDAETQKKTGKTHRITFPLALTVQDVSDEFNGCQFRFDHAIKRAVAGGRLQSVAVH